MGIFNIKYLKIKTRTHYIIKSDNMDHLKASFERELKNKLSEKTKGAQSEQQVLMKAFKYFDLNDNGTVEPEEFAKAIEKIGIQIPTKQDLDMLFSVYDVDGSGGISYKEFSSGVLGTQQGNTTSSGGGYRPSTGQSGSGSDIRDPEALSDALKNKLATRGARGMIGL